MPTHDRARTIWNVDVKIRLRRINGYGLCVQRTARCNNSQAKGWFISLCSFVMHQCLSESLYENGCMFQKNAIKKNKTLRNGKRRISSGKTEKRTISQRNDISNEWKRNVCKDKWLKELIKKRLRDKRRKKRITNKKNMMKIEQLFNNRRSNERTNYFDWDWTIERMTTRKSKMEENQEKNRKAIKYLSFIHYKLCLFLI